MLDSTKQAIYNLGCLKYEIITLAVVLIWYFGGFEALADLIKFIL